MTMFRLGACLLLIAFLSGCALYSDVAIQPLRLLPSDIERGADIEDAVKRADYLRAVELAPVADARTKPSVNELAALGEAFLACGRYDDARRRLRAALDLRPFHTTYAQIAWSLSQVEYLDNNYTSSLEWAQLAAQNGLSIRRWHIDYLNSLSGVPVYRFRGATTARTGLRFGRPSVPRLDVKVNGKDAEAILDTGAVVSIVSARLAAGLAVKSLGDFEGTFYGLLGEPIQVRFGLVESLEIGDIIVENVPVAIMPDDKMRFLITEKEKREFRMDLLLGANLLKEFRVALDFDSNRALFTKLTARDRQPAANQNLFMNGFRPHVHGTVNRRGWFLFVLDTGSEVTFLNETQMYRLPIAQNFGPRAHSALLQGLGGAKKRGAKVEDVQIGLDKWAGVFKTLPMYTADERESSAGIIGENFLRHFNVTIDFGRMRLDLVRR